MKKFKKTAKCLAVVVNLGATLCLGGAYANVGESLVKVEAEEIAEAVGSLAYDYDPISVEEFAAWARISVERARELFDEKPYLFQKGALESEGGFNPFTCSVCDVKSAEELDDGRFSEDQAWKWFKFRSLEVEACYEDEVFDEATHRCVAIKDVAK